MVKIRKDLVGVITAAEGVVLRAGDKVPAGVFVGGHATETGEDANAPVEPVTVESGVAVLTDDEIEAAENLEVPTVGVHPERVRGALVGYQQGWDDAVRELHENGTWTPNEPPASGEEPPALFDPSEHNADVVHEHLAEHPDDVQRVLELERNGKARSGILSKYED